MRILGIDQSYTSTGFVIIENDDIVVSKVFAAPKERSKFDQAASVASFITMNCNKYTPKIIGLEGLAFGIRGNATRDLAGLQFAIAIRLREKYGKTPEIISPKSIKLFATGSGKAKKLDMFESLPDNIKQHIETGYKKTKGRYDITDAYWIAKYMEKHYANI